MKPTASHALRVALLSTVATTALASMAHAQEIFDPNAIYLDTIYLGADDAEVSAEDLERDNPADLADLFKAQPALTVGGSLPSTQKLYARGVEENNMVVTIDGSRQNNKVFHHSATTVIDPDLLKAVRLDPGVAPADAGPGGVAGSIAYETKDARDLLEEGDTFGGRVGLDFNSNGNTLSAHTTLYGAQGGFDFLVYGKRAKGDEFVDGNGDEVFASTTNFTSGIAKIGYDTAEGRFELSYENVLDSALRPHRANFGDSSDGARQYDYDRSNLVFSYKDENVSGFWNPSFLIAKSEVELATGDNFAAASPTLAYTGTNSSINGKISNEAEIGLGTVTFGVDFFNDKTYAATMAPLPVVGLSFVDTDERLKNTGVFAQARLDLSDSTRLSVGGRYDWQKLEATRPNLPALGYNGESVEIEEDSGFSGNISIEHDVNEAVTVSAGYAKTWAGFNLPEAYVMSPFWAYDSAIPAATGESAFIGATSGFGSWDFKANAFITRIDDARFPLFGTAPFFRDGFDNTKSMEAKGFELGATYSWADGFVSVGFSDVRSTVNGKDTSSYAGNYLTIPLGKQLNIQVAHQFNDTTSVGADLQHGFEVDMSDVPYDPADVPAGYNDIPSYTVANAYVEHRPARFDGKLAIRGQVNNIFDAQYYARGTYGQEAIDNGFEVQAEPGRSFLFSVSMEF